jgi:hypothetical protein
MLRDLPSGSKIVKLTIETEPKLLKLNRVTGEPCPIERLFKRSELSAMLGSSYANAVNKQLEKAGEEPNFEARLLWRGEGEHVEGSPFLVRKKGSDKHYLAFRLLNVVSEVYLDPQGKVVNPEDYKNFLPLASKEAGVVWRTVSLDNVKSVIYADKEWL